ncbi:MAG: hypothetical protein U5K69_10295 [Balneolaceae bacterium]|nr:hypothetical protein [Balneolaceae bacterium]
MRFTCMLTTCGTNYSVFDDVEEGALPLYYGVGGRLILAENDSILGVRVPAGINYLFEEAPVGLLSQNWLPL